jgi:hypothetical protein
VHPSRPRCVLPPEGDRYSHGTGVITTAGGLGADVPRHKGPSIGFIACNLAPNCTRLVLIVVKFCKGRVTAAPSLCAAMDRSYDLLPEIEQIVFAVLPYSGVASPNLRQHRVR